MSLFSKFSRGNTIQFPTQFESPEIIPNGAKIQIDTDFADVVTFKPLQVAETSTQGSHFSAVTFKGLRDMYRINEKGRVEHTWLRQQPRPSTLRMAYGLVRINDRDPFVARLQITPELVEFFDENTVFKIDSKVRDTAVGTTVMKTGSISLHVVNDPFDDVTDKTLKAFNTWVDQVKAHDELVAERSRQAQLAESMVGTGKKKRRKHKGKK